MFLSSQQIRRWFGPMPGRNEARAISVMTLAAAVIICGISLIRGLYGQTFMGRPMGGDFVEFYTVGKILNNFDASRIYDLKLEVDLQHSILPSMAETQMLVFGHAPYVALLFKPFAAISYFWSYVAWLAFSAILYLIGITLLFRATGIPREHRATAFLLALSFMPFVFETWIGAQLSIVPFFLWSLFFHFRNQNRLFFAGFALALGLFKPTLLALPVAMLIVGRRWRILQGFAAGAALTAALSIGLVGLDGCRAWVRTVLFIGRQAAGQGEAWHLAKSVDMSAFFHLLLFNISPLTGVMFMLAAILTFAILAKAWWRSRTEEASFENWLWAATICLTLVANAYAPIYDSILVVIAAALIARAIQGCSMDEQAAFRYWLLSLYIVSWLTQSTAEFLHLQVYTLVLAGLGLWTLRKAYMTALSKTVWQPIGLLDGNAISTCSKKVLHPRL
jgi:hypothetical protein